jgi:putative ABC transport system permease protein
LRSPRWTKVVRDLWLHKARTGLVVSAICVGIISAGTVLDAWSLVRRATHDSFDASNPASATLYVDAIDDMLLANIQALPAVAAARGRRTVVASAKTAQGWRTAVLMSASDFTDNRIGVVKPARGAWPPAPASVVIEQSSVEFSALALGDSLVLQVGDGPRVGVAVGGIARDVGVAPGWMEHVIYLYVAPQTLAALGAQSTMNELQLLVRDRTMSRDDIRRVARDAGDIAAAAGHRVRSVNVPVPGRHIHAGQIDSLLYTQGAFGLLVLVLSGVLVVNLISAMLTGQVREIGVMKAIGARPGQLVEMYLGLALVLGVIACAISIPAAALLGRLYAEFTASLLNFDVSAFHIPGWSFALQLSVGALMPVVAAAFPVARGARISVSDALRDTGTSSRGESRAFIAGGRGLSRPLLLSLRNAFRRRERMVLTLATLSIGGAVYLGALNLRSAVAASVDLLFSAQQFDMAFRIAQPRPADSLVAAVSGVPGVARAEAWTGARAIVHTGDGIPGTSFVISAPPLASRMLKVNADSGRWLAAGAGNEIVVNRRLLEDEPALALGKEVTLLIDGRTARWHIVGVAETGPQPMAYSSRETIERLTETPGATSVVVAATDMSPAGKLALARTLRTHLSDRGFDVTSSQSMAETRAIFGDHLSMVAGFLGDMSLLMIVVGGLGLASTMSLAVLERTREIGVLRAIGARHTAILSMIQVEGLVIALLGWLLAIPLSLPMSIALGEAFGRVMLKVPVHLLPNRQGVLQWLGVVAVVSIVACAWPARRATRITTAAALAYE